jgi:Fe-S oxidoreductase
VITLCPTCTTMLIHGGPDLIMGAEAGRRRRRRAGGGQARDLRRFAERVVTFSQFLARHEKEALQRLLPGGGSGKKVTYHDSCHHKYVLEASEDSRALLRMARGSELVEMTGPASCCGFGGAFSVDHPEIAASILEDKLAAVAASGADIVALDCPGCLLQIRGGCARSGRATEIRHTAEILAEAMRED